MGSQSRLEGKTEETPSGLVGKTDVPLSTPAHEEEDSLQHEEPRKGSSRVPKSQERLVVLFREVVFPLTADCGTRVP